jgi:hypothetical protein
VESRSINTNKLKRHNKFKQRILGRRDQWEAKEEEGKLMGRIISST